MTTFQDFFTPIFIIASLFIFIVGIVVLKVIDNLFKGSKLAPIIRIFFIGCILSLQILMFLVMSFNKVKFQQGPKGPTGNKGKQGDIGDPGGLQVCDKTYETVEEKKTFERALNYLDTKPPIINPPKEKYN